MPAGACVRNAAAVIIKYPEKAPEIGDYSRLRKLRDGLDAVCWWLKSQLAHRVAKVGNLILAKLTLAEIDVEAISRQNAKDVLQVLKMFFMGDDIDDNVVDEAGCKEQASKKIDHVALRSSSGMRRNSNSLKVVVTPCCLVNVLQSYQYLVVRSFYDREDRHAMQALEQVLERNRIPRSGVARGAPVAILFSHHV